jgi:hypothetical protein
MSSCEFGCKLVFASNAKTLVTADIKVRCQSRHTPYSWKSKFVNIFDPSVAFAFRPMYCPNIGFLRVFVYYPNTRFWCRVFLCEHVYDQNTRLWYSCAPSALLKQRVLVPSLVIILDLGCWINGLKLDSSIIVVNSFGRYLVITSLVLDQMSHSFVQFL